MDVTERIALRIPDAVAVSGIGTTTLYEAMQSGALAYVKVGARRLILRTDLEQWLNRHRVSAEAA
jgi:excisionase family DNA binding protein